MTAAASSHQKGRISYRAAFLASWRLLRVNRLIRRSRLALEAGRLRRAGRLTDRAGRLLDANRRAIG